MKKNKKDAFTLVELLAVIVILAIILVIAVPKVMDIIEDAKKGTLESTAKMIAGQAEKVKVQNTLLGKSKEITCDSVATLNNIDYKFCKIDFDYNEAYVTIEGKGKFNNLYVCDATKTSATASDQVCTSNEQTAAGYIEKLFAKENTLNNGLVKTTATIKGKTVDTGIRYVGSNPNNYVYFNCEDTHDGVSYGSDGYDYNNACEIWRIIGIFDVAKTEGGVTEKRIKIIRNGFTRHMSWDMKPNVNNVGAINQWGDIKSSNGDIIYEGSELMKMLNGYYIRKSDTCTYYNGSGSVSSPTQMNCSKIVTPLSITSLGMVDDALWHLGAIKDEIIELSAIYQNERSLNNAKICIQGDELCNDTITRKTEWVGKIGLIYPSDYAYASKDASCKDNVSGMFSTCVNENWLYIESGINDDRDYWTISPCADYMYAYSVWYIDSQFNVSNSNANTSRIVHPTLYLSSKVEIIGGNGGTEPFKLGIQK